MTIDTDTKPPLPRRRPTLAEILAYNDRLDAGEGREPAEPEAALAASWRHMQQSCGWR